MTPINGSKTEKIECPEHGSKYMLWTPDISDAFPELGKWVCLVCAGNGPLD